MIIKRKLYSLHTVPEAKAVASGIAKVMVPIKTAAGEVKYFLLRLGNGGGNPYINASHEIAKRNIKTSALRSGVKVGHIVEKPGEAVLDGAEIFGRYLDANILAGANTATALTVGAHNPALGVAIQNCPSTLIGLAGGQILRAKYPGYNRFMNRVGKNLRWCVSKVTGLTPEKDLNYFKQRAIDRPYRQAALQYRYSS